MELIAIEERQIGQECVNSVNARELHVELGITKHFTQWIETQIKRSDLAENKDFLTFNQKVKREGTNLSSSRKEYILTLDSAKHIAMMSQSKKAKEIRDYFIDAERKYIKMLKDQNKPTLAHYQETVKRHGISYDTASLKVYGMEQRTAKEGASGALYIALRPLILGLGLDWETYRKKVKVYGMENYEYVPFRTKGGVQEMLSLATDVLPEFLSDIKLEKVKKHVRERIITFRKEVLAVLNGYWNLNLTLPSPKPKALPAMTEAQKQNEEVIAIEQNFTKTHGVDAVKFATWMRKMSKDLQNNLVDLACSNSKDFKEGAKRFLELSYDVYIQSKQH